MTHVESTVLGGFNMLSYLLIGSVIIFTIIIVIVAFLNSDDDNNDGGFDPHDG